MFEALFASIESNTLLLTANNRLATRISNEHHDYQVSNGLAVWPSIEALPFNSWLQRCWEICQTQGTAPALTLLNDFQDRTLWQSIIHGSKEDELLQVNSTAHLAQKAWELLKQWQVPFDETQLYETHESLTFMQWAKEYRTLCQEKQWIDNASLIEQINKQFNKNHLAVPKKIILIGFVEPNPAMDNLLKNLEKNNCTIEYFSSPNQTTQSYQLSASDIDKEIETMARWTKKILDTEEKAVIGCVIPELNKIRTQLERTFDDVFTDRAIKPFNISSGNPLANEPIIYTALEILRFHTAKFSISEISHLLHSPFLDQNNEFIKLITCDARLRERGNTEYDLKTLLNVLQKNNDCPKLLEQLQAFQLIQFPKKQKPSEWSQTFISLLNTIGWPGHRSTNSREYQANQQWENLLAEFSKLDMIESSISFARALAYCRQFTAQTIFQPQTKDTPPIQILGILEAVGMPFTHLWVMGLDDQQWPKPAKPNALLPSFLQRQLNMPHSSAQRELHFSNNIHKIFSENANTIIYSFAKQDNDRQLQVSPLIKHYNQLTIDWMDNTNSTFNTTCLETLNDEKAPPIRENETIRGGTSILKEQAACPFRAFAKLRLHAKALQEPEEGITAKEKGSLLHKTLELFWRQTQTSTKLHELINDDKIKNIISHYIDKAFNDILNLRFLSKNVIELEKTRLHQLILNWLLLENERESFDVTTCEEARKIILNTLTIHARIDRIDHLSNNTYALIDYKTGKANLNSWFGDRPDEPQLPLYAISSEDPICALAFAQIRSDEIKFKGISQYKDILPQDKTLSEIRHEQAKDKWNDQLQSWKHSLEKLAEDFCNGRAEVNPKYTAKTCEHCDLQSLCRIYDK